jgi:hypothetical protein
MTNFVRIYSRTSQAHAIAVGAWARDCTSYDLDYVRFCSMNKVKPLSEKQFKHIVKVCNKQQWEDYRKEEFVKTGHTWKYAGVRAR